jgi:hypothetical protein
MIDRIAALAAKLPVLLLILLATGCGGNLDSAMWECQLDVQKANAGRSPEALEERARDIEACMAARGYRLDVANRACQPGATNSTCYLAK